MERHCPVFGSNETMMVYSESICRSSMTSNMNDSKNTLCIIKILSQYRNSQQALYMRLVPSIAPILKDGDAAEKENIVVLDCENAGSS